MIRTLWRLFRILRKLELRFLEPSATGRKSSSVGLTWLLRLLGLLGKQTLLEVLRC